MSFRPDVFLHDLFSFNFAHAALTTIWISLASLLVLRPAQRDST